MYDVKPRVIVVGAEAAKLGQVTGRKDEVITLEGDLNAIRTQIAKMKLEAVDPNNMIFVVSNGDEASQKALQAAFDAEDITDKTHLVYENLVELSAKVNKDPAKISNDILDVAMLMANMGRSEVRTQLTPGPQGSVNFLTVMSEMGRLLQEFRREFLVETAA